MVRLDKANVSKLVAFCAAVGRLSWCCGMVKRCGALDPILPLQDVDDLLGFFEMPVRDRDVKRNRVVESSVGHEDLDPQRRSCFFGAWFDYRSLDAIPKGLKGIEVAVLDHEIFGDDHFLGGWRLFERTFGVPPMPRMKCLHPAQYQQADSP